MKKIVNNRLTFANVFVSLFVLALTSCSTYLGPVDFVNESAVYQKPMQKGDTLVTANYIKGSFHKGKSDINDIATFGTVSYNKSYTKKKNGLCVWRIRTCGEI
ncbi:hypothetical protein [Aquimarina agarilytica]|uniref:hypothetical protein n=1 Tax=Aquimarina agarilytica TaxID=1087449 RepID=UPI000289861D|nr:hypothetical protein [Aquimarina agarilytica]